MAADESPGTRKALAGLGRAVSEHLRCSLSLELDCESHNTLLSNRSRSVDDLLDLQFRGGGVVHGPVPRSHEFDLPKRVRRLGLKCALSVRDVLELDMATSQLRIEHQLLCDQSLRRLEYAGSSLGAAHHHCGHPWRQRSQNRKPPSFRV